MYYYFTIRVSIPNTNTSTTSGTGNGSGNTTSQDRVMVKVQIPQKCKANDTFIVSLNKHSYKVVVPRGSKGGQYLTLSLPGTSTSSGRSGGIVMSTAKQLGTKANKWFHNTFDKDKKSNTSNPQKPATEQPQPWQQHQRPVVQGQAMRSTTPPPNQQLYEQQPEPLQIQQPTLVESQAIHIYTPTPPTQSSISFKRAISSPELSSTTTGKFLHTWKAPSSSSKKQKKKYSSNYFLPNQF